MPNRMLDTPVGLWWLVPMAEEFGFAGAARADFLRSSIRALLDAGGIPVRSAGKPDAWLLQSQYGTGREEIVEAIVVEGQAQGSPIPPPWTGLAFGLPRSYGASGEKPIGVRTAGDYDVRMVTPAEFDRIHNELLAGAQRTRADASYNGVWFRRHDGFVIGLRFSEQYGLTLEVIRSNHPTVRPNLKVHQ